VRVTGKTGIVKKKKIIKIRRDPEKAPKRRKKNTKKVKTTKRGVRESKGGGIKGEEKKEAKKNPKPRIGG